MPWLVLVVSVVMPSVHPIQPPLLSVPSLFSQNPNTQQKSIEPVAFSAVHASKSTRRFGSKLVLDKTVTDIGYGWYSDRSEFVCYYPGTYFFAFNGLSTPTSQFK